MKLYHHETLVFSSNQLDIPRGHFGKKDSVRVSSMSQLLVTFETCCVILPTPSSDIRRAVSSISLMYIPCWAYIYIYSLRGFSKLLRDKIRHPNEASVKQSSASTYLQAPRCVPSTR